MSRNGRPAALFAALVLTAGSTGATQAADIAKPVYKAAPVVTAYSWTGFYIGGHLGGAFSDGWNGRTAREPIAAVQWDLSFGQKASGFIGGGQIGYNWQFAPQWVVGIEADFSSANLGDSNWMIPVPLNVGAPAGTFAFMNRNVDWIGTVRGRIGHTWDRWLVYATGGFAYGQVSFAGDVNFRNLGGVGFPTSFSSTQTGWTVGGGVEHAFPATQGSWTVRGEYLYYALEAASSNTLPVPFAPGATSHYRWNETAIHTVRLGLNYKFGR